MSASGPNYAGTVADVTGVGSLTWANPTNAQGNPPNDSAYASQTVTTSVPAGVTHWLWFTNFGFSIPSTATINNIQVEFRRWYVTRIVKDYSIKLVVGGSVAGSDKSAGASWASSAQYDSFSGAPVAYWGLSSITSTQINASNFGVALSCIGSSALSCVARVNAARITITYTLAGVTYQVIMISED